MKVTFSKMYDLVVAGFAIIAFLVILGVSRQEPVFLLLRGIIGFLLLTIVPGLLILYIMNINPFERGTNLLYSIGLSMVLLIFLALFLNVFYPLVGNSHPLSPTNILINFVLWLGLLLGLLLFTRKNLQKPIVFESSRYYLVFAMFPILSILGAKLVDFYSENVVILALLFALSTIPLLVYLGKISTHLYPVAILAVSLSLQLHKNLVTNYVIGADIQNTFYFANLVKSLQLWDPQLGGDSPLIMLTVVPTLYSSLLGISIDWVFKLLNSILYALTPVCIFYIFRIFSGEKAGFYAALFFAFQHGFIVYGTPCKQPIAEFFMSLLLLSVFDESIKRSKKNLLMILFSFAMINSHYGASLVFFLSMTIAFVVFKSLGKKSQTQLLSPTYYFFFPVLLFSWFMYTAQGEIFSRFIKVWEIALKEVWLVISAQKIIHRTGAQLFSQYYPLLEQINMAIYLALTACMVVGVFQSLRRHQKVMELDALALSFMLLLFMSFFIAGGFGVDRMYVLSSVVLSGYLYPGYRTLIEILKRTSLAKILGEQKWEGALPVLLSVFLLFNTGVTYYLAGAPIESAISINPSTNTLAYSDAEMYGAKWLVQNIPDSAKIYCDFYGASIFKRFYHYYEEKVLPLKFRVKIIQLPYFLTDADVVGIRLRSLSKESQNEPQYLEINELLQIESITNKIYDNGAYVVYG